MKPAAKHFLIGQICLYSGLAFCILLKPAGLAANDGISYYGIYRETFLTYAIALLSAAYFTVRTVENIPHSERILSSSLQIYAPLIVLLTVTPYASGKWVDYLHTACGSTLFSLQLLLSAYLIWRLRYRLWGLLLISIELLAGVLSAFYLNPTHGFLFQTQVIFQLAFGLLLVLSLELLELRT